MYKTIIIFVLAILLAWFTVVLTGMWSAYEVLDQAEKDEISRGEKFCFKEFLPYGESTTFKEDTPGDYTYRLIGGHNGLEVWVTCKK